MCKETLWVFYIAACMYDICMYEGEWIGKLN